MSWNEVERVSEDGLSKQVWDFVFFERYEVIVLNRYFKMERPTKRHGWSIKSNYDRILQRDSMSINYVPLPDDVHIQVHQQFCKKVQVRRSL